MTTACETCKDLVIARVWTTPRAFIEVYACGAVHRWGEDPAVLQPCPKVQPLDNEHQRCFRCGVVFETLVHVQNPECARCWNEARNR